MGTQGEIEVRHDGRRHKRFRTPRAVLRALELVDGRDVQQFTEEQILEWVNAAAPLAASKLIYQLRSSDETIALQAAIKILEWSAGKPRAAKADLQDQRARVLFNIVVPEKAPSFEEWVGQLNAPKIGEVME